MVHNFWKETIAVWRRDTDKVELHLHRDGLALFYFPRNHFWKTAVENTHIELVEQWLLTDAGAGFRRV